MLPQLLFGFLSGIGFTVVAAAAIAHFYAPKADSELTKQNEIEAELAISLRQCDIAKVTIARLNKQLEEMQKELFRTDEQHRAALTESQIRLDLIYQQAQELEALQALMANVPAEEKPNTTTSLAGCPFRYCDKNPHCVGECRYA